MLVNAPANKTPKRKANKRLVGIRLDLDDPLEKQAYEYIELLRGDGFTPRQVVVAALVNAANGGGVLPTNGQNVSRETIYRVVIEAMRQVIGDGQLIVSNGALAVQNTDGTTRAIMSQEAKNLLGFVDELGEF